MYYAEEMILTASACVYSLAIIVWVNNFQAPKVQVVLRSFFVRVMILHLVAIVMVDGGWRVGSI